MRAIQTNQNISNYHETIAEEYKSFIIDKNHPCIMANTVFSMEQYSIHTYDRLGSKTTASLLLKALGEYIENYDFKGKSFESFIVVFPDTTIETELEFENLLWRQLQFIHEMDSVPWDSKVSDDPNHPDFSFSILGHAFYVVGLHPKSSRMARKAPYPTLVFNLHSQFDQLREMGVYHKIRDKIRQRDKALQGSINPVLEDFGHSSEARQYSGRNIGEAWKCPFHKQ